MALTVVELIALALDEDLANVGDITTRACVPAAARARARLVAREPLVVSGLDVARLVFLKVDPSLGCELTARNGERVERGATLMQLEGAARSLLTAERTALNFVGRLSGIATHTRAFVEALGASRARMTDTRKTTPLHRQLEKAAVVHGGGVNHRFGLFDGVLIKDNHVVAAGSVGEAVRAARAGGAHHLLKIGVEVDRLSQIEEALAAGADHLLLDNMDPATLRQAVQQVAGRATTEASGNVRLTTVAEIAATGVDFISSGSLTHGARWVDVALDFDPAQGP